MAQEGSVVDSSGTEPLRIQLSGAPANDVRATMRRADQRGLWLWSISALVMILLLIALSSFLFPFPGLLSQSDPHYSLYLNQIVRTLVFVVLLFNVYAIFQQLQINRIRRQMTDQIFAMDKMEVLAEEVYRVAILDSLTGLYNRRYIEQRLCDEMARSNRLRHPLTVVIFDLDDFKRVNDQYGHAAGDRVLTAFCERLKRATRGCDAVGRYGGDEFLAVLPECKTDDVQYVLKRVSGLQVDIGSETVTVAFSVGMADFLPGESAANLLERADQALYSHKSRAAASAPSPVSAPTINA